MSALEKEWLIRGIEMKCPRCEDKLVSGTYEEHDAFHCHGCAGTLFQQAALGYTLERFSADLYSQVPLATPVPKIGDKAGQISCPMCEKIMENYGYMGTGQVMLDACNACELVWVDALELAAMAKMRARLDKNMQIMRDAVTPMPITSVALNTRAIEAMLLGGFTLTKS